MKKAVILLSGGLDSTTLLAYAKSKGYELYALSFYYGQRHQFELEAAQRVAQYFGVKDRKIINIDLRAFGGSALTAEIDVPKGRTESEMEGQIPITYVPARNTIFLSFALAYAEVIQSTDIFIGVNAVDYSGYPDCRPDYIKAYQEMGNLATKSGVEGATRLIIHTPLIDLKKSEIIKMGLDLGVDYAMTSTCYDPNEKGLPCGICDSCVLRLKGFSELGMSDPAKYDKPILDE
ncbi:MAG TPA: 7-cyano-7-deazaguanine synthase QueC [Phaeodactylibacter sp.]|nr:7-cyano-7-deazaguanine synthase QueC [Phaeodactylibacter sp.]